jgi:2-dehydro-3-deoxyphosphogluconate aldolase/(4S)-4-hydroxy-2-oxoglutarate aldolase
MPEPIAIRDVLARAPVIPVLVVEELAHAAPLARALCAGGLTVLEITLRTPVALAAIEAMRAAVPTAIVGAGTLTRAGEMAQARAAGAQFGVTPGLTRELAAAASAAALPLLPGVMTPAELLSAREAGFDTFKFFPAREAGGVPMLQAFAGPFAEARFCPTGGITRESAPSYLELGNVLCVGGSWPAPASLVRRGDWAAIEKLAREAATLRP